MLRKDELKSSTKATGTSDPAEVARFNRLAEEWWRPDGAFKVVHRFNRARVEVLRDRLPRHFRPTGDAERPFAGLSLADVGCGAGLVAERMAAFGADVLGIDAAERNVAIARRHADASGIAINYRHALPEALVSEELTFDVVLSLEVIEHVADVPAFLDALARLLKPGGLMVIGTLNRTPKSFALAIVGAEYVLGWLPRGTHDWRRFVKPEEIVAQLSGKGFVEQWRVGIVLEPLSGDWRASTDCGVNYLLALARRP